MAGDQESTIANHYTTENLLERIKSGLIAEGKNPETPNANDLKGVDEFHTGGVQATDDLLDQLTVSDDTRVLDIGCGIGGTSRHLASNTGAVVTGLDLTPDYIETARALSNMVGMSEKTQFHVGSALNIPFAASSFDLATMFHVGMNIADKPALFREAARVLAPAGTFALFDIMQTASGDLRFPFPWAENADGSVVESPEIYKKAADQAGFELLSERNRRDFTLEFFDKAFAAIEKNGAPPAVGIHLLMKETGAQKLQNYVAEVKSGKIAPFEMIFRRE
ncbi:MAG: methyltransferase domain-containing protein [Granulosicoccus sp.]|nr:methyltransferase domain-containing protein [Granulosicoccus sp.]